MIRKLFNKRVQRYGGSLVIRFNKDEIKELRLLSDMLVDIEIDTHEIIQTV